MGRDPFAGGKVPPYSKEAECAVLGAILLNNKAIGVVDAIIDKDDFFVEGHRVIYGAMMALRSSGAPIDHVTLGQKLHRDGHLEKIGGAMALDALTDGVATAANVEHYAAIIYEQAGIRRVLYASQKVLADAWNSRDAEAINAGVDAVVEASDRLARARMPSSVFGLGAGVLEMYRRVAGGYRGIELPWPTLDNMTAGMWPKTLTMFVARPGCGKCVRGDTPILDPDDGIYRPICEVVQQGRMVLARTDSGVVVPVRPDAFLYTGRKRCIRISLASGRELSGTPEHPVMTVDGWRRLDEIAIGHYVETVRKTPEPVFHEMPPDEEVILLAALLAEGGYTSASISFTNQDPEMVSLVSGACDKYGIELRKTKGMRRCDWVVRWKKVLGRGRDLGPNPARVLLDKYGCGHRLAKEKTIPDRVFSFSNDKLALFLGVLWGCDGYVNRNATGITLASEKMVRQIQQLLLRFGVLSNVGYKPAKTKGKVFDSWRLRVYSSTLECFRQNIDPVVGRKRHALDDLRKSNPNVDNIPMTPAVAGRLRDAVNAFGPKARAMLYRDMGRYLGMKTPPCVSHLYRRDTVSRRTMCAFIKAFRADEFTPLTLNHWDKVVSVASDGEQDVYDLTVVGPHSFVANDVVVHNTFIAVISARHAWINGKRVLIVSPEMSKEEIAERFFVIEAGISYRDLIHGQLSDFTLPKLEKTVEDLAVAENLWIMDSSDDITPRGIESAIRACHPDLVAVDSMYDLRVKGERRDRMLIALEWMKDSAKRLEFACCGFAQQNRTAELSERKGGGARLGTIALADEIGQDAHAVFALEQSKDDKADKILWVKPLKLRRGQISKDRVGLNWDFDKMLYDEIPDSDDEYSDEEEVPF